MHNANFNGYFDLPGACYGGSIGGRLLVLLEELLQPPSFTSRNETRDEAGNLNPLRPVEKWASVSLSNYSGTETRYGVCLGECACSFEIGVVWG